MREKGDWFAYLMVALVAAALLFAFAYEIWQSVHCGCVR